MESFLTAAAISLAAVTPGSGVYAEIETSFSSPWGTHDNHHRLTTVVPGQEIGFDTTFWGIQDYSINQVAKAKASFGSLHLQTSNAYAEYVTGVLLPPGDVWGVEGTLSSTLGVAKARFVDTFKIDGLGGQIRFSGRYDWNFIGYSTHYSEMEYGSFGYFRLSALNLTTNDYVYHERAVNYEYVNSLYELEIDVSRGDVIQLKGEFAFHHPPSIGCDLPLPEVGVTNHCKAALYFNGGNSATMDAIYVTDGVTLEAVSGALEFRDGALRYITPVPEVGTLAMTSIGLAFMALGGLFAESRSRRSSSGIVSHGFQVKRDAHPKLSSQGTCRWQAR